MRQNDNLRFPVKVDFLHDLMFVVIIAVPIFGTFFPLDTYIGAAPGRSATIVLALILLLILALFAMKPQKALFALKRNWLIIAFAVWALTTSSWAEVPSESFTRSGRLLVYALYGIYLAEILPPQRSMRIVGAALLVALLASLAAIALMPRLATSYDTRGLLGTWRGALGHKNSLGFLAGFGFLYGLIALKTRRFDPRASCLLVGLGAVLMVLANSVTSMLGSALGLGLLFYVFYVLPTLRDRLLGLMFAALVALLGVVGVQFVALLLDALGRDVTLTGRSSVWAFANFAIEQNPIWGYGHGAWKFPIFAEKVLVAIHFSVPHAHNTWLDLRVQLGLPGFVIGILLTALAAKNLVHLLLTLPVANFILPAVMFVMLGVRSYSETVVLDPALSDMFMLAFAYASFAKLVSEERAGRRRKRLKQVENGLVLGDMAATPRFGAEPMTIRSS